MYATSFILTKFSSINRRITTACLLAIGFVASHGQVLQTKRFEAPINDRDEQFQIITAEAQGLFLYRTLIGERRAQLQLIKLDTSFTEVWNGALPVEPDYHLTGKFIQGDNLYLLMRYKDFSKNDFLLYRINQHTSDFQRETIRCHIPFNPTEFQVTADAALIGGYFNRIPVVIHFSLSSFKSKVLPGIFNETGELTQIRIHPDGSFDVLISAQNWARQRTMWIKNYDAQGDLQRNMALDAEENTHLIFGRSIKTAHNMQMVAGVYGTRSAEYSRGIFISKIEPTGLQQTKYYNFGDLENFFKYMKSGREQRVKKRIERKKIKGKKIRFNYRFLVHEIIPYKNQYIMLGEAFYPKYIMTDQRGYGGFFTPTLKPGAFASNGRIFDGYYYTHAVVMGFDLNGNLLWDNSFEINDVKTFTLDQFVKLEVQGDKLVLLYMFDNEIRTKKIQNDSVLEGKTNDAIKSFRDREIVKSDNGMESKLEYWYKDNLYAYGVQRIIDPTKRLPARKVFYINKITFPH